MIGRGPQPLEVMHQGTSFILGSPHNIIRHQPGCGQVRPQALRPSCLLHHIHAARGGRCAPTSSWAASWSSSSLPTSSSFPAQVQRPPRHMLRVRIAFPAGCRVVGGPRKPRAPPWCLHCEPSGNQGSPRPTAQAQARIYRDDAHELRLVWEKVAAARSLWPAGRPLGWFLRQGRRNERRRRGECGAAIFNVTSGKFQGVRGDSSCSIKLGP